MGGQETIHKDHDSDKSLVGNKNEKKRKIKTKFRRKIWMLQPKRLEESIVDGSILQNLRKQHSSIS